MNRALLKRILRLLSYAMLIMLIILMIYSGLFEFTKTDSLIELLTFTVTRFGVLVALHAFPLAQLARSITYPLRATKSTAGARL